MMRMKKMLANWVDGGITSVSEVEVASVDTGVDESAVPVTFSATTGVLASSGVPVSPAVISC